MTNRTRAAVAIAWMYWGASCRTGNQQSAEGPPTVGPTAQRSTAQSVEVSSTVTPRATKVSKTPPGCGSHGRPLRSGEIPRVHGVAAEDVRKITALVGQHTGMPVIAIRRHGPFVEASAGCCTPVPHDCSVFRARLDKQEGLWTVVDSSLGGE